MTARVPARPDLHRRLAELVESCSAGQVRAEDAERAESLVLVGVDSLASLRLVDAVEREFGIALEVDDGAGFLDSVDGLTTYLLEHGLITGPAARSSGPAGPA